MNHLLDHDHTELDLVLDDAVSAVIDGAIERALERLDVFWARLAVHIRAENTQLFPALLGAAERSSQHAGAPPRQEVIDTVARLRADHDFFMSELTAAMKELRQLHREDRGEISAAALARVRESLKRVNDRLDRHNALEEARAYRWVSAVLDQPEQKSLVESIGRELENVPERLRKQPRQ